MKKKLILVLAFSLLLTSIVSAGILNQLTRQDRTLEFTVADENYLKTRYDIPKIEIETSEILCDDKDCWASVEQDNLIHTKFRTNKDYCSEYNEPENEDEIPICLTYTDYTQTELRGLLDDFVKLRVENIVDVSKERETAITNVDGAGTITRGTR